MQDFDVKNELCSHIISFFGERLLFARQCERMFEVGRLFISRVGVLEVTIFLTYTKKIAEFLSANDYFIKNPAIFWLWLLALDVGLFQPMPMPTANVTVFGRWTFGRP